LWLQQSWVVWLAAAIAGTTAFTSAVLGKHTYAGGAYLPGTVAAMSLRTLVWVSLPSRPFPGAGWGP
jgi:hypothetical protein